MRTTWWGISVECPDCHKSCTLQGVMFSADGELRFLFSCFGCKQVVQYNVFSQALQHRALMNDVEADEKRKGKGIVTPPLALPAPSSELTSEDRRWERAMGIDPDDGKEAA